MVPDCLTNLAGQLAGLSAGDSTLLHLADVAGYPVFLWHSSQSRRGRAEATDLKVMLVKTFINEESSDRANIEGRHLLVFHCCFLGLPFQKGQM